MPARNRAVDVGSYAVIAVTLVLFVLALAVKGFTKELLLEVGVFVVSVKLILLSHKHEIATAVLEQRLEEVRRLIVVQGERLERVTGVAPTPPAK